MLLRNWYEQRFKTMTEQIQVILKQVGTDVSGKWISVDNAEKFAQLVIEAYNKTLNQQSKAGKNK